MKYKSIINNLTCIIPFYNEDADNVRKTVETIFEVKQIHKILLVDDGSDSEETFKFLKDYFSLDENVEIVRLDKNYGKSFAVRYGLYNVDAYCENIILLDADLKNIDSEEIINAIINYRLFNLDMLILRRINSSSLVKLFRADTLLSGERIIKKKHLYEILNSPLEGYELEIATNQYFIQNNLQAKCRWAKSSAVNNYKYRKLKIVKGLLKDVKMHIGIVKYVGVRNYIKQISSFCKKTV
jgi:glycosyltransferase involved in cell wall biosynthesis